MIYSAIAFGDYSSREVDMALGPSPSREVILSVYSTRTCIESRGVGMWVNVSHLVIF